MNGLQRFDTAELQATPWKNGGGTTRQVACWPPGAGSDDFDWRVSIATIAASGPFSTFPGIDRTIMLLDGPGVHLRSTDGALAHRLDQPLTPFGFAGEVALECELLGGASNDFNVMVRRDRFAADVRVLREPEALTPAAHALLFAVQGDWTLSLRGEGSDDEQVLRLVAGEGVWWSDGLCRAALQRGTVDAVLINVIFKQKAPLAPGHRA